LREGLFHPENPLTALRKSQEDPARAELAKKEQRYQKLREQNLKWVDEGHDYHDVSRFKNKNTAYKDKATKEKEEEEKKK
jgi:hypothetical protein